MHLAMLALLTACTPEADRYFCGGQELDRDRRIDGDRVSQLIEDNTCWAVSERENDVLLRRVFPGPTQRVGNCTLTAATLDGPFDGDCHWWGDDVQIQAHLIPEESQVAIEDDLLQLDLRVWTTDWNYSRLYEGDGDLTFTGEHDGSPAFDALAETELLPTCYYDEECYEGPYVLTDVQGPPACSAAVQRREGQIHRVLLRDDFSVELDGTRVRSAPDLETCAVHYADDEDPFDTLTYTLFEGQIQVSHFEQFDNPNTGQPVLCELEWYIPTSRCAGMLP